MLVPEAPFVFARDGKPPRNAPASTRTSDGARYMTTLTQYRRAYIDQLHFTNQMVMKATDEILANSPAPPVILIASSRGPGFEVDVDQATDEQIRERLGVLMMAYVPGMTPGEVLLPEGKACLANLFRGALGRVFGISVPLESAGAYLSDKSKPGAFHAVPVEVLLR
jgi:hypothetical protein